MKGWGDGNENAKEENIMKTYEHEEDDKNKKNRG